MLDEFLARRKREKAASFTNLAPMSVRSSAIGTLLAKIKRHMASVARSTVRVLFASLALRISSVFVGFSVLVVIPNFSSIFFEKLAPVKLPQTVATVYGTKSAIERLSVLSLFRTA